MTIPKSLEAKFEEAGQAGRRREAILQRQRAEHRALERTLRGRERREAKEAHVAVGFIWDWLSSDDARALCALAGRHRVQAMLSGGIPPGFKHAVALGTEPGTLWVLRLAFGVSEEVVRSPERLERLLDPALLISLAGAIRSGEVFQRVARELERDAARSVAPQDGWPDLL